MAMVDDNDAAKRPEAISLPLTGAAQCPGETPGVLLRQARERAGLSRAHIAARLNLLGPQVVAIEEDRFDRLPGDTFTIGYLRNYARAVEIDAGSVLQAFYALRPQSRPALARVEGSVSAGPRKPLTLDAAAPRRHYWGIAAAALVMTALWGWQQIKEPVEVLPLTADINGVDVELPGGLASVVADEGSASLLDRVELHEPAAAPQSPAVALRAVATLAEQPAAAVPASLVEEITTEGDRLNLRFSADCWVEVKDRDNRVLVAALKRADDQLTLTGRGPFKVVLGFAPGVEMAFNGERVDIDTANGGRAARLIVGNS